MSRRRHSALFSGRWGVAAALALLLAGLAATAAAVRRERANQRDAFDREVRAVFDALRRDTLAFLEVLDAIRALSAIDLDPAVTEEATRAALLYQRRVLGAYAFAQKISDATRRGGYEETLFPIVETDPARPGEFRPRPAAAFYMPITSQTPPAGLGLPNGFDLGSRKEDAAALAVMEKSYTFAIGGDVPSQPGAVMVFAPIRNASGEFMGLAAAPWSPAKSVAAAKAEARSDLDCALVPLEGAYEEGAGSRLLQLGNRAWIFRADPGETGLSATEKRIAAVGLAGSLLVSLLFLSLVRGTRRLDHLVAARTKELEAANQEREALEKELLRAQQDERERIGRDLHDSLGQKLTGALFLISPLHPAPAAKTAAATLKEAIADVRRVTRGLSPLALAETGLPEGLRGLARDAETLFGFAVALAIDDDPPVPESAAAAEHLYQIAQEAVTNAARHAGAKQVAITLARDGETGWGLLAVDDDGKGLGPEGKAGGNGLRLMRHRAELIRGKWEMLPSPLGGLRIACRFPLSGGATAAQRESKK
ncbi:MAG: sensor histidine kinase [Kiritimatiellae bacterium]|nr:sensor histidine kinase [Kiritimatiellia bacterium]